jgi:hypothetical protein
MTNYFNCVFGEVERGDEVIWEGGSLKKLAVQCVIVAVAKIIRRLQIANPALPMSMAI